MKEDRNWSATVRGSGQFDDEITLPLRIICERKLEPAFANPREEPKQMNARDHKEAQEPIHAA
jgi:hypothetical protein